MESISDFKGVVLVVVLCYIGDGDYFVLKIKLPKATSTPVCQSLCVCLFFFFFCYLPEAVSRLCSVVQLTNCLSCICVRVS